jgi:hypothetical protein
VVAIRAKVARFRAGAVLLGPATTLLVVVAAGLFVEPPSVGATVAAAVVSAAAIALNLALVYLTIIA